MGDLVETPTRLGRYAVLRHLATGGMAEVLLARATDGAHPEHVVLKRIRPDQARDERFVQMFLDEARIASRLDHPNVARVFETGEDRGEFYFAMEYVHGEDLRNVLMEVHHQRDKVPIALVTGIVASAAAGLHHAHQLVGPDHEPLGIVHRDVSPANILIGYDGSVKVVDFGIAKAVLRSVETRSGALKGKVSYMSPEQVVGKPIDRRSDVFALGIVLYELTTTRRLFKGDNDFLTMSSIVQGDIPQPSLFRPDLPRILEDIIMTALAADPSDRFQTADELRAELEAFTTALGMRMSASSIADYMKKLFGVRPQPWLADDEPTMTTSIDFDGSESGLAAPPEVAVKDHSYPQKLRPSPHSPIVFARTVLPDAPPPQVAWQAPPFQTRPSSDRIAWSGAPPAPVRSRRRLLGIAAAAAVTAGLGMVVVVEATGGDAPVEERVEVMAQPPAPPPAPPPKAAPKDEVAQDVRPAAEPAAAPAVIDEAKPPPPKPVTRPRVEAVAKKPARAAKRPAAKTAAKSGQSWDPNALFAPK